MKLEDFKLYFEEVTKVSKYRPAPIKRTATRLGRILKRILF